MTSRLKKTNPVDLYLRALASAQRYVMGVQKKQWKNPTPCTEWNVRDVVNHLVYENLWAVDLLKGKTLEEVGDRYDGDLVGKDPQGAFDKSMRKVKAVFAKPGAARKVIDLGSRKITGKEYAGELFIDSLIHGWDVAKATGQDTKLDPELVAACYAVVEPMKKGLAGSGMFAPPVRVARNASLQAKLLALLGRRA